MPRKRNGVAADGSVTIDLNRPPPAEDKFEPDLPDYGTKPAESAVEVKEETRPEPRPAPPEAPPENDLEAQLKAMRDREAAAHKRAQQAEAARLADQQRAQAVLQQSRGEVEQSQYDSVANALLARQNEIVVLKQQKMDARLRGDTAAELEIDDKLQDAKIELKTLQDGKADFEARIQQRQQQPPSQPQYQHPQAPQAPQTPQAVAEWVISQRNDWRAGEADWLRAHPDAVADPAQFQQLQAAAAYAEKRGIQRGTQEYFRLMNERLGYDETAEEPQYDEVDMMNDDKPASRPLPSAPPTRPSPGLSAREAPSSTRVTLTPLEREHAKISKISEHEYARNKAKLIEMKRRGMYGERG